LPGTGQLVIILHTMQLRNRSKPSFHLSSTPNLQHVHATAVLSQLTVRCVELVSMQRITGFHLPNSQIIVRHEKSGRTLPPAKTLHYISTRNIYQKSKGICICNRITTPNMRSKRTSSPSLSPETHRHRLPKHYVQLSLLQFPLLGQHLVLRLHQRLMQLVMYLSSSSRAVVD